jgi:hypothetical protein
MRKDENLTFTTPSQPSISVSKKYSREYSSVMKALLGSPQESNNAAG